MDECQEIVKTLDLLYEDGDRFEVRLIDDGLPPISELYTAGSLDPTEFAQDKVQCNRDRNVFVTLNPLNTDKRVGAARDSDVACRRWLFVDVDAERPSGQPATQMEKAAAESVAAHVYSYLCEQLGSDCLIAADSGNGAHILIRLPDVENSPESRRVCRSFLKLLDAKFSSEKAKIDITTANAARLAPLYGVMKRKGKSTDERPHRRTQFVRIPSPVIPADWSRIVELTSSTAPVNTSSNCESAESDLQQIDIEQLLQQRGVPYEIKPWENEEGKDVTLFVLAVCPFNAEHDNKSAWIARYPGGGLAFGCHHNSCTDHDWNALVKLWNIPRVDIDTSQILLPPTQAKLLLVPSTQVDPEAITWLWQDRFVMGGINLCAGRGGIGKTYFLCDLVARITNDDLTAPNGDLLRHGRVLYASGEDHIAKVLEPRMRSHGVDRARLEYVQGVPDGDTVQLLDVISHCELLDQALSDRPDTVALVIDPVTTFQGMADSNKVAQVRRFTASLAQLAEKHDIAVLGIHHFSKGKREVAGDAVSGSHAYRDASRALWLFALDTEDPSRRLMVCDKHNWAEERPSGLAYTIVEGRLAYEPEPLEMTADELLSLPATKPIDKATAWLEAFLHAGARPSTSILAAAAVADIAEKTLRRAKDKLGIKARQTDGQWEWYLPGQQEADPK